ncbi:MAG: InlB B-repeat-containing protein, partial [Verrucomicrobiales bacterium]
ESPWTGQYFRDYPPTLTAEPAGGATFVGWSGSSDSTSPTIQLPLDSPVLSVTAIFQ